MIRPTGVKALELCPDALYLALSGKSVEEAMPGVRALTEKPGTEPAV